MSTRADLFLRLRRALPQALLPDVPPAIPEPPLPPPFEAALVDVFAAAAQKTQAVITRLPDAVTASKWLVQRWQQAAVDRVLVWQAIADWLPSLPALCRDAGIELAPARLDGDDRKAALAALADIPVGLTGADAGLARTGSLVLYADSAHGRLASLLPETHYAVLPASRLYPDLAAWLADAGARARLRQSSNTVVITGPSRSADIAQTLTLGAHGPRSLHVLLLED